jgi:protein-S-isoprenylcysteine O-methyltransferase Ste14
VGLAHRPAAVRKQDSMINNLAKLKYWEIITLGLALSVTANLLLMFAVRFLNGTWPQTNEAAHVAYVIISSILAWVIVGIFVEAVAVKWRMLRNRRLVDEYLDMLAGFEEGTGKHREGAAERG